MQVRDNAIIGKIGGRGGEREAAMGRQGRACLSRTHPAQERDSMMQLLELQQPCAPPHLYLRGRTSVPRKRPGRLSIATASCRAAAGPA